LLISYENLCSDTEAQVSRALRFVGKAEEHLERAMAEVKAPQSIGRWRRHGKNKVERICSAGQRGLEQFGYCAMATTIALPSLLVLARKGRTRVVGKRKETSPPAAISR
jgi:hypothetical protein